MTVDHVNLRTERDREPTKPARSAPAGLGRNGAAWRPEPPLDALDVQGVRLVLEGGSVVDWRRLGVGDRAAVCRLLRANGYDPDRPEHLARLEALHARAIAYLHETFEVHLPDNVRRQGDPLGLFLLAAHGRRYEQRGACVVLKVMHVLNHLDARRLAYHLSVSERALFEVAHARVAAFVAQMARDGVDVIRYEPSTKSDRSLVTKLISKPRVTAAQIFDKLRFRLVVDRREDLLPALVWFTRRMVPLNHVIPGESHNTILGTEELNAGLEGRLDGPVAPWLERAGLSEPLNPATARAFRMINFVVDLPLNVEALPLVGEPERYAHLGHLVFVSLEVQLFDRATWEANQVGDASHDAYKRRQQRAVAKRLWGQDVPALKALDGGG